MTDEATKIVRSSPRGPRFDPENIVHNPTGGTASQPMPQRENPTGDRVDANAGIPMRCNPC